MSPRPFLLLDLDGTLSDPQQGIARSINHALASIGRPVHDEAALTRYIGPPLSESFRELVPGADEATVQALLGAYRQRYGAIGYAENTLYTGVPEALAALADAGATLVLCTSKRVDFAEQILQLFGLRAHFAWLSGGRDGLHKWQQLGELRAEGRVPDHAVMIGDRAVDLIAARRNGLAGGAVRWGHGSEDELAAESPAHWFDHPQDWLRLVADSRP